ncbi:DUF547 domain-containing protein [Stappia sp. ES.058]|uniref:DUF547 domain-containing protein n=1 Tax=Stappia sp. ES.058 TaxID=1881061 RepID=UPI00087BF34F|nr:DUF547 domain-containing protein [Stappia sp. ES.058]SDT89287.1 Protein of unknown function, DUF547 [Stappia sp. ES.058]
MLAKTAIHGESTSKAAGAPAVLTRRMLIAGAGALALAGPRFAQAAPSHDAFTELLQRYVVVSDGGLNRVRYAAFKSGGRAALDRYVEGLAATRVSGLGADDAFAFWVNLYNAVTLQVVLEHYPVASIRDIDLGGGLFSRGPWKKDLVTVEGRALSLDDIEHGILRKRYDDARVHYAVNCASVGCPDLAPRAYTGASLAAMLDEGARGFVNTPRGVRVEAGGIRASKIYSWFSEDFGSEAQLRAHWRRYARPGLSAAIEGARGIAGYRYDWSLNDAS